MIQRFYFVKLLDAEVPVRAVRAQELADGLRAAGADATVGLPADASAARWDLSIVIRAPSLAAWEALAEGPGVTAMLDQLADCAEVIKGWTFAAVDAG